MNYGLDHRRLAAKMLRDKLAKDVADLEALKVDIANARDKGEPTTRFTNKRRSVRRSITRTKGDLQRMEATIKQREGWVDANKASSGDN